ncbi:IS407A, transposase OrfA, truncation [Burkholderia mallei ATCC 23344]|nr:IS407A, transposase OrfA, truncation [Burkholderia mallei ATCC 23344]
MLDMEALKVVVKGKP